MEVDRNRVHLLEVDIENWLFENPGWVRFDGRCVSRWLTRQLRVPNGIIDLLGVTEDGQLVVVEIKNTPIDAQAITQVKRYAFDIDHVIRERHQGEFDRCIPVVIGKAIDGWVFSECEACGVYPLRFAVAIELELIPTAWSDALREKRQMEWIGLAHGELFAEPMQDTTGDVPLSFLEHLYGENGILTPNGTTQSHINGNNLSLDTDLEVDL